MSGIKLSQVLIKALYKLLNQIKLIFLGCSWMLFLRFRFKTVEKQQNIFNV